MEKHSFKTIYSHLLMRQSDNWTEMASSLPPASSTSDSLSPDGRAPLPGRQAPERRSGWLQGFLPGPSSPWLRRVPGERSGELSPPLRLHSRSGGSTVPVACSEDYAPVTPPPAARRWFHARRGELRGPQTAVYLCAPTSTQPPEQKCHSERSWPLSPVPAAEPRLGISAREKQHAVKQEAPICSWLLFSCSVTSDSLWPHGLQHARLPCPSPSPRDGHDAQTHAHRGGDAIQPSHPLSSPSLPAFSLSHHQGLLQWLRSSHQVAKVLELQFQHEFLPTNVQDWFPLGWTGWISLLSKGFSRVMSNTTGQKHQLFST